MRITLDPVQSVRRLPRRGIDAGPSGDLLRGPWPRGAGRAVLPKPCVQLVCQDHLRAARPRPPKRGSQGGGSSKLKKGTPCSAAFLWLLLSSLCPSPTQLPAYSRRRINAGVIFPFILCSIHSLSSLVLILFLPPLLFIFYAFHLCSLPSSLSFPPFMHLSLSVTIFSVSLVVSLCLCRFPSVLWLPASLSLHLCLVSLCGYLPFCAISRLLARLHLDARAPPGGDIVCPSLAPMPSQPLNFLSCPCRDRVR